MTMEMLGAGEGTVNRRAFFSRMPDLLTIETVANRLYEIAASERITSSEAQWLIRANQLLEQVLAEMRRV